MASIEEKDKQIQQEPAWRDLPSGGLMIDPGSAEKYQTGDWRTLRPIWNAEKCISCMICWMFCPDSSIKVQDGKVVGIDYDHCKGCGICAAECPPRVKAIEMQSEADFR